MSEQDTPYERGYAAAKRGEPGPPFPTGDASWAEKLFARGWADGAFLREAAQRREEG